MAVVLLIMTVIMAAMAPVMTTRLSGNKVAQGGGAGGTSIWKYVEDSGDTDIYYGTKDNQRAMIGQNKAETAENARLILNTSDDIPNHLIFRKGDETLGLLKFDNNNSITLGTDNTVDKVSSGIVIGKEAKVSSNCSKNESNFIAIGTNAHAQKTNSCSTNFDAIGTIAIGTNAYSAITSAYTTQTISGTVAIGTNAYAASYNTIAIGTGASVKSGYSANSSIAIGANARAERYDQVVIGAGASADNSAAIAIGVNAKTTAGEKSYTSIAIGPDAQSTKNYSIAIGDEAKATARYAVAIGYREAYGLEVSGEGAIGILGHAKGTDSIGIGASVYGNKGIAIGGDSSGTNSINIGCDYNRNSGDNVVCIGDREPTEKSYVSIPNRFYLGDPSHIIYIAGDVAIAKSLAVKGIDVPSDKKLKNIDKEYTSGLDKIKQLKPFNFTYKDDKTKTPRVGVIAQDLKKVFPDAVSKGKDGFLTIRLEDMFYALINAVKELDLKVTQLIKQESDKDKKIKELEKRIELLEQKLK